MVFTTHPKNGKRKPNKRKKNYGQNIADSMLFPIEVQKEIKELFHGEIRHTSFDCPTNLREAFKQATSAEGTSECKILQELMYSYIVAYHTKKHALGNTFLSDSPSVIIESVVSNQYNQTRPRRIKRKNEPDLVDTSSLTKICKENDSSIIFPSGEAIHQRGYTRFDYKPSWDGPKVNLEQVLDNWANISTNERINAAKYAQAFPSTYHAHQVLIWYENYLTYLKKKNSEAS